MNGTPSPRTLTGGIWHETRGNVWEEASCSQSVAGKNTETGPSGISRRLGLERQKRAQGLIPLGLGNDVQSAWPWFETVFGLSALGVSELQELQSLCWTLTTDKSRDHPVETI